MQETGVRFWGWEDPLEKEMATHSSILAWRIPRTEDLAGMLYGVARVRHDLVTKLPTTSQPSMIITNSDIGLSVYSSFLLTIMKLCIRLGVVN